MLVEIFRDKKLLKILTSRFDFELSTKYGYNNMSFAFNTIITCR